MALSSRCMLKTVMNVSALRSILAPQYRSAVSIAPRNVSAPALETHDQRNARLQRPQSPHLTIYRPQVTSMLSITHRMTGLALADNVFRYRCVVINPRRVEAGTGETHDARNARLGRPQSPHLSIYQPQLTWLLSITHRATGIALTGYVYGVGVTSLVSSKPFPQVLEALHGLDPTLISSGKFLIALPFAYHFVNGIRHLIWDSGKALTIKGVYTTGYVMLAVSSVLTIGLMQL